MTIYLSCWAMAPDGPHGFDDLVNELQPAELKLFVERLDDRQAKGRQPASPEAGRAELLALIAEEEEHLEEVLEQHLERDETVDPALLFDGSEEGERLRRYEATCDRGLHAGAGGAEAAPPRRRGGCDRDCGDAGEWPGGEPPADGRRRGPRGRAGPDPLLDRRQRERDERSQRPSSVAGAPTPPRARWKSCRPRRTKPTPPPRSPHRSDQLQVLEPDGDGPRAVTNEANGPSPGQRRADDGQRTTDKGHCRPCGLARAALLRRTRRGLLGDARRQGSGPADEVEVAGRTRVGSIPRPERSIIFPGPRDERVRPLS